MKITEKQIEVILLKNKIDGEDKEQFLNALFIDQDEHDLDSLVLMMERWYELLCQNDVEF